MPRGENNIKYKKVLIAFFSFRDDEEYTIEEATTKEILRTIKEEDVLEYLKNKAYGTAAPTEDDRPSLCRSSTLYFHKKAISFFIPNKHMKWNVDTKTGNPTMSPDISLLIKEVKQHEVRQEGKPSKARREITRDEFILLLKIAARDSHSFEFQCRLPTMAKFQLHLMARIDDTSHVKAEDFIEHNRFEFALLVRLRWTKNCMEERDAPLQIILGSMDTSYCLIIALGIYLQFAYEFTNAAQSEYLFCDSHENPIAVKKQVSSLLLRRVFESDEWIAHQISEGNDKRRNNNCGTHSIRKMACTVVRLAGRSQDEAEARGRWRDTQRVSDRYTAISLPFIDAHVAAALCIGGAAKYECKEESNLTDNWLAREFVPHIAAKLGNRVAVVLGKALLYCVNDKVLMLMIPQLLRVRLKMRYLAIQVLDETINPINKIQMSIYSANGQLQIDPVMTVLRREEDGVAGEEQRLAPSSENQQALVSQQHALRSRLEEVYTTLRNQNDDMMQRMQTLHRVVARIGNRPAQINRGFVGALNDNNSDDVNADTARANNGAVRGAVRYEVSLSANPKDLYHLWEEYEFGVEGRKPARKFTSRERGQVKYKYHRGKVIWDLIAEMIRNGHTYLTAIDNILDTYGRDSTVSSIINRVRRQRGEQRRIAAA